MQTSRREFLIAGAVGAGALTLSPASLLLAQADPPGSTALPPLPPISTEERQARVAKAQGLMREAGVGVRPDALVSEE